MFRKTLTAAVLAATVATFGISSAAEARRWDGDRYYDNRGNGGQRYYGGGRDYDRNYYRGGRGGYYQRDAYRGSGRRCRGDGSTGLIIGAIAGGLLGNSVAGYGDRTVGTVIGGGAGALAGRAIDRSDDRC